jgi:hypothetical protein
MSGQVNQPSAQDNYSSVVKLAMPGKLELLNKCSPVSSAVEFGGIWRVDMVYLKHCIKNGAKVGYEVDEFKPKYCPNQIRLVQGDFRSQEVVDKCPGADLVILYDIMLHQANCFQVFRSLTAKASKFVAFSQPMYEPKNLPMPNGLFFMPGEDLEKYGGYIKDSKKLIKGFNSQTPQDLGERGLDNHAIWLWAMSPSLVRTWFTFLGFEVVYENKEEGADNYPWEGWLRWGCLAKRVNS